MKDVVLRLDNVSVDIPMRGLSPNNNSDLDQRIWHDARGNLMLRALDRICLEVKRGEKIGITGANGSGKTTLLRVIAGLMPISGGSLEVSGSVRSLLTIGGGTYPALTGRKNTYLRFRLLGISSIPVDEYILNVEAFAELGSFFDLPLTTYSPGMMSRLQFAMNTVEGADVLLLDEWMGVADQRFHQKARKRLQTYLGQNEALLFVSHNQKLLERTTDISFRMQNGVLDTSVGAVGRDAVSI